jgi:hypothetical protein
MSRIGSLKSFIDQVGSIIDQVYKMREHFSLANARIFSTLDLTSGFWQMKLDEQSQPLTAFSIHGKG